MMDFSNFIFRSHYQGYLVNVPKPLTDNQDQLLLEYSDRLNGVGRALTEKQKQTFYELKTKEAASKTYKLNTTAENLCTQIAIAAKYGRVHKVESKYFAKGIEVEKKSRDLISSVTGLLLTRCKERKSNDWVSGEVDVDPSTLDFNLDVKSSYTHSSFFKHLNPNDPSHELYFRQGDCYMELWDRPNFVIAYVLIDTPYKLVNDEIRKLDWKEDILTMDGSVRDDRIEDVTNLVKEHIYTREGLEGFCDENPNIHIEWFDDFQEIPENERLHIVHHQFDKTRIEQRNECLTLCRQFMNNIKINNNIKLI